MRVLVLGGTGYIGARLCASMKASGWATPVCASRHGGPHAMRLDTCDEAALAHALRQVDAVVHCVTGSAQAIAQGAQVLARAAATAKVLAVVHLSSMAVYGDREGRVDEATPLLPARAWYGRAKQEAEAAMRGLAASGGAVTVLRPGCVWGPGSWLWVGRVAQWLQAGRLGDLGPGGDGWTNGVHVDDVCEATLQALRHPPAAGACRVLNLAAPDSPRWNDYFAGLALAIGATPLRRIPPLRLRLDAWVAGPVLQAARRWAPGPADRWPWPVTPQLVDLWARQLRMDGSAATRELGLAWVPFERAIQQGAAWWLTRQAHAVQAGYA